MGAHLGATFITFYYFSLLWITFRFSEKPALKGVIKQTKEILIIGVTVPHGLQNDC